MVFRKDLSSMSTSLLKLQLFVFSVLLLFEFPVMSFAGDSVHSSSCAVVGCGVLGTSLCKQLLTSADFDSWRVTGITKTTNNHESIMKQVGCDDDRFEVATNEDCKGRKFQNVVFCAPPSGFEDYPAAVDYAAKEFWAGPNEGGIFVFTSSGGIYSVDDGSTVTESSPTADPSSSPRIERLLRAEEASVKNGGCCLRLAGLYTANRGAHGFWLNSGKDVNGGANGIVNQLHYDDAASSCMAALRATPSVVSGKTFLISDGNPLTRKEIVISALGVKSLFGDKSMPKFLGKSDSLGKIYDGSFSNKELQWSPKYASFSEFMANLS